MPRQILIRVEARHFCAGVVAEYRDGVPFVTRAAPILKWSLGRPARELTGWLERKRYRWSFSEIQPIGA